LGWPRSGRSGARFGPVGDPWDAIVDVFAQLAPAGSACGLDFFRPQPKRTSRGYERSTSPSRLWEERSSRR
ncbi:hypothetical protein, partial [Corynebacterium qintianiae]|uniref:hypothetical protein n=1 Tax=Corynebacterium qintianiae TaxID=2709392 RepID=UPI001981C6DD